MFGFLFACPGYRAEIVKTDTIAVLLILAIYLITLHHSESDQGRAVLMTSVSHTTSAQFLTLSLILTRGWPMSLDPLQRRGSH